VIAGGLLQDLEDRLRRDLAPIEERVRPGEETRGLAGDLVIDIPGAEAEPDRPWGAFGIPAGGSRTDPPLY